MVLASAPLELTYTGKLDAIDAARASEVCYVPGECISTEPFVPVALVVLTGVVTLVVAATLVYVDESLDVLETERERTRVERDAFDEFARRVVELDTATPEVAVGATAPLATLGKSTASSDVAGVKDAYRDTLMSVPHYDEEYDEPLEVNMTAELGPELTTAVVDGTVLTPQLQSALVRRSEDARSKREEFLRRLDREASSLAETESRLTEVEEELDEFDDEPYLSRGYEELREAWTRLRELEDQCRSLLVERQDVLRNGGVRSDEPSFRQYLYDPLDVDYPVLASGAEVAARVDDVRRSVEAAMARRS